MAFKDATPDNINFPTFGNMNNNGTNAAYTPNTQIQTGWAAAQPGAAPSINLTVTFPKAFANVPIVVASYGGDTAAVTSTLGAGGPNVKQAFVEAYSLKTTGCTIFVTSRDNSSWAAGNTVYVQWIAIGI